MAKIMKYCGSCEEGFAEKFTFCPDCGGALQAFEMNPLAGGPHAIDGEADIVDAPPAPNFIAQEPATEYPAETEFADGQGSETYAASQQDPVDRTFEQPAGAPSQDVPFYTSRPMHADERLGTSGPADDDGYRITVIEEKNGKQRNVLLLGATFFMLTLAVGATIASLFNKALGVDAIGNDQALAYLIDEVPMTVEEEKVIKEKDKGGGGGGGGRDEKDPTSQGDLADQSKTPIRPPDVKVPRLDNPALLLPPPSTEGDRKFEKKYNQWGDPNSKFLGLSNGTGTGGGQGSGTGTGQGSGSGTGAGSGSGSGSGGGDGTGNGDGTGGGGSRTPPPPPVTAAVTQPIKIIYKPKATYTDEARTNNVQGSVRLKITLLASGQVGSITPVTRLGYGLTEQAIAAARQIKFEPAKVNGVAVSKIVTFDYGFNIY